MKKIQWNKTLTLTHSKENNSSKVSPFQCLWRNSESLYAIKRNNEWNQPRIQTWSPNHSPAFHSVRHKLRFQQISFSGLYFIYIFYTYLFDSHLCFAYACNHITWHYSILLKYRNKLSTLCATYLAKYRISK